MKKEIEEKIHEADRAIHKAFKLCDALQLMIAKSNSPSNAYESAYAVLGCLRNASNKLTTTHQQLQPTIGTTTYKLKNGGEK